MFPGSAIIGLCNANSSIRDDRSRELSTMQNALEQAKAGIARVKNNTTAVEREVGGDSEFIEDELWDNSLQSAGFMITSAENFLMGIMGPGGKFMGESARTTVLRDIFSPLLIKAMCSMYSAHYSLRLVGRISRDRSIGLVVADVIASLSHAVDSAHSLSSTWGDRYGESTALFCVISRSAHVLAELLSQLAIISKREPSCEISASVAMLTGLLGLLAPAAPASAVKSFNQYYPGVVSAIINQIRNMGDADIQDHQNVLLAKRLKDVIVNATFVDLHVMKSIERYKGEELLPGGHGGTLEEMDASSVAEDIHAKVKGVRGKLCESLQSVASGAASFHTSPCGSSSDSGSIVDSIIRCRGSASRRRSRAQSIFSCSAGSDFSVAENDSSPPSVISHSCCSPKQSCGELNL
ncbi:MAG: hypothetical protein AB8U44_04395 [Aaplasma endosymbiont of Hyalomma asiaticum]